MFLSLEEFLLIALSEKRARMIGIFEVISFYTETVALIEGSLKLGEYFFPLLEHQPTLADLTTNKDHMFTKVEAQICILLDDSRQRCCGSFSLTLSAK